MSLAYRPEIDGLRALAVIPVILFHAGFSAFAGGFVGVDVFFVISGYLITGIVHGEILEGRFSIGHFYERRARRILPALMLVSAVSVPFALLWLWPDALKDFSKSLLAVNLFASNVLFWMQAGYFDHAAELKPLLHTWSLGVEEQFYLFFPLLLLMCRRLSGRALMTVLAMLSLISLLLAEWCLRHDPSAAFYLLPFRGWELGVGAMLALAPPPRRLAGPSLADEVLAFLGLAGVLYAIFTFDKTVPFPGHAALWPVLGTGLVIRFGRAGTWCARLLGLKPVVALGLISYSAYLWHQPMFAFARIYSLNEVTGPQMLALALASLVLAWVSWRFVERPFRNRQRFSRRQIFTGAAIACTLFGGLGFTGYLLKGLPGRIAPEAATMAAWAQDGNPRGNECQTHENHEVRLEDACRYNPAAPVVVTVWGDSHAGAITDRLAAVLAPFGAGVREIVNSGCPPSAWLVRPGYFMDCHRLNRAAHSLLVSEPVGEIVVLYARWACYIDGHGFRNGEGGYEYMDPCYVVPEGKDSSFIHDPARPQAAVAAMVREARALLAAKKHVVLVYPTPEAGWNVPMYLAREINRGIRRTEPLSIAMKAYEARTKMVTDAFDALPDDPNLVRVRPGKVLCGTALPGRCVLERDGQPLYVDSNHPTRLGATLIAREIEKAINAAGWLDQAAKSTSAGVSRK